MNMCLILNAFRKYSYSETRDLTRSDFRMSGWLNSEVCRRKVDTRDELLTRRLDTAAGISRLTPNDPYMGRTAPLTSKRCILYIYSTNIGTEYFKHALYSLFLSVQNAVCFIMLTCLVPVLFTFYIQGVLKLKK